MRPKSSLNWRHQITDLINHSLPVEALKDIPNSFSIVIVTLAYILILCGFLYSYITSYRTLQDEVYLSLSQDTGSCSQVTKVISGVFLADTHGNWEGSLDFEYRSAIYVMTLRNFNGEKNQFTSLLNTGFEVLDSLSTLSYDLNLAGNLIIWMAITMTGQTSDHLHTLQLYGDPKIIFNLPTLVTSLSNEENNCDVRSSVMYDRSVGIFTISYPMTQYLLSSSCMSIANPEHFGYTGLTGSETFSLRIDMQSAITALGINTGMIAVADLEMIPYTESTFVSDGITYTANYYYYPRYPGMTPLYCANLTSSNSASSSSSSTESGSLNRLVCAILYGNIYAYPLFNHLGASFEEPIYCDCENDTGSSPQCNGFLLLTGLLFYDYHGNDSTTSYNNLMRLVTSTASEGKDLNRQAYNISADSLLAYSSLNSTWRHTAYEFCTKNSSQGCSVLSLGAGEVFLHTVSPYYYQVLIFLVPQLSDITSSFPLLRQVPFGSCNNSFTISTEAQEKLLTNPPTQLTEMYYECSRSKGDSLLTALGVSVGNTVLIRYLLIALMSFLLFGYHRWFSWCPSCTPTHLTTYTNKEKEGVLHFLAFNLLLSRDGLYDQTVLVSHSQGKERKISKEDGGEEESGKSLVRGLQHELSLQNNIRRFYPVGQEAEMKPEPQEDIPTPSLDLERSLLPLRPSEKSQLAAPVPDPSLPAPSTNATKSVEIIWNPLKPLSPPPSE
jgi:hypothetical protein